MYQNAKHLLPLMILLFILPSARAAVTFDGNVTVTDILYYNSSNASYTVLSNSDFDFFPDTAQTGDMIHFGWDRAVFDGMYVNVSTPLNATVISLTWEYYNASGAWVELTVTDNTNNFTTTGVNRINWTVPDWWEVMSNLGGVATADGAFVRARAANITGMTEGGRNSGFSVQLQDYTVTVTGSGNRMSDIKTASDNGNWGIIDAYGGATPRIFLLHSNLRIGDSTDGELILRNNEVLYIGRPDKERTRIFLSGRSGNNFTMGVKSSGTYGTNNYDEGATLYYSTYPAGNLMLYNVFYGTVKMYHSKWIKFGGGFNDPAMYTKSGSIAKFSSFIDTYTRWYFQSGSYMNLTNVYYEVPDDDYFYVYTSGLNYDGFSFAQGRGILSTFSTTYANIDYSDPLKEHTVSRYTHTFINCEFADFFTQMLCSPTPSRIPVAKEKYTLDFVFLNETGDILSNVNVTITDAQGQSLHTGEWTGEQDIEVRREFRNTTGEFQVTYIPLNITIEKENYQDINTAYNLTKETDLVAMFHDYPFIIDGSIVIKQPEDTIVIKRCS